MSFATNCHKDRISSAVDESPWPLVRENGTVIWHRCPMPMFSSFSGNHTFADNLQRSMFAPVPNPHHGWFLMYLFFFSQILASLFTAVHPNHQVVFLCVDYLEVTENFKVKNLSSCFKRPVNKAVQLFCCLNFFGYFTPDNETFLRAVKFWLGHPIRLFLSE